MKKLISIIVALILVMSLAACSGTTTNTESSDPAKDQQIEDLQNKVALQESMIEEDYRVISQINDYMDKCLTELGMSLDYDSIETGMKGLYETIQDRMNKMYELELELEKYKSGD